MKVYTAPDTISPPEYDYNLKYDREKELKKEEDYKNAIKDWLLNQGFTGKLTGEIFCTPMGDGYAQYMFADGGRKSFLIHLNIGDAWDCRDVAFLPKKEVIRRMESRKGLAKLFSQR